MQRLMAGNLYFGKRRPEAQFVQFLAERKLAELDTARPGVEAAGLLVSDLTLRCVLTTITECGAAPTALHCMICPAAKAPGVDGLGSMNAPMRFCPRFHLEMRDTPRDGREIDLAPSVWRRMRVSGGTTLSAFCDKARPPHVSWRPAVAAVELACPGAAACAGIYSALPRIYLHGQDRRRPIWPCPHGRHRLGTPAAPRPPCRSACLPPHARPPCALRCTSACGATSLRTTPRSASASCCAPLATR